MSNSTKNTSSTDPDISNGGNNDDDETGGNVDNGTSDDSNVDDSNSDDVSNNIKLKPLKQWSKKRRESDRKTDARTRRKRQDW